MSHTVLLLGITTPLNALLNCLWIPQAGSPANIAEIRTRTQGVQTPSSWILEIHHENLKSLVYLALLSSLFFFFFSSHTGEKNNQFSRFHWWDLQHQPKTCQRLRQKLSPELIKGDKKGSGEGEGRWKLRGRGGLGPTYQKNIFTLVKSQYDTPSLCYTHTHTLADTHVLLSRRSRSCPLPNTHTHTNPCDDFMINNLNRCSVLQMVWLWFFPRSVEDQKSIKKSRGSGGQPGPGRPQDLSPE